MQGLPSVSGHHGDLKPAAAFPTFLKRSEGFPVQVWLVGGPREAEAWGGPGLLLNQDNHLSWGSQQNSEFISEGALPEQSEKCPLALTCSSLCISLS